jgi:DNA replication protein DnaC
LVQAICHQACGLGMRVRHITIDKLPEELRASLADETRLDYHCEYSNLDKLNIDGVGCNRLER